MARRGPTSLAVGSGYHGVAFVAAALQWQPMDFEVPPPGALALFGVLLGGKAYLVFSKPLPPRPERR